MKKNYSRSWTLLVCVLLTLSTSIIQAQTMPEFTPYTKSNLYSWNTAPYQSFQYPFSGGGVESPMRFRLITPNGFNRSVSDGKKYPLIIFLHGSGEAGPYDSNPNDAINSQDNEKQLVHGGQTHMNAVLNNNFPGIVVYPQIRRPDPALGIGATWGNTNLKGVKRIVDKLILDYKVDPDRIYIHGLSLGGEGALRFMALYPQYIAAAHPMSAAGSIFWANGLMQKYVHIPMRQAQGALDTAPSPQQGNDQVQQIRSIGGSVRYSYYYEIGHGVWNSEYAKPDFFSWFLSKRKNNIHVFNEQTSFCAGDVISVRMGLTAGFLAYQWAANDTISGVLPTATLNEYTATSVGKYYARFQRVNGVWTKWSSAVDINTNKLPSSIPAISSNGQSLNLPPLDGSPDVLLSGSGNKGFYLWKRDGITLSNTSQTLTTSTAGLYTLASKDPAETGFRSDGVTPTEFRALSIGCISPFSSAVTVTTQNGLSVPAAPTSFFSNGSSTGSVILNWNDRSTNETGFEVYRSISSGSGYKLITILPPSATSNPQTYTDNNLVANKTYYYKMRAVNTSGGSAYTPEVSTSTFQDVIPPSSPVLTVGPASRTEINLVWSGASDNTAVLEYDVFQNGLLIATTSNSNFKATGLIALSTYNFVVKARDAAGNISAPSNQVTPSAVNTGLFYRYYHHNNLTTVNDIERNGTLITTGVFPNFQISPRSRNDGFAFIYEGYINISTAGSYSFYLQSDDGSQLYVNNTLAVSFDGTHGCTERSGTAITLSVGTYPIKVLFFENGGGECLNVKWQGPGVSKDIIPSSVLSDSFTPPIALVSPGGFVSSAVSFNSIQLNWNDNSTNETGFEISRSSSLTGTYQVVTVAAANSITWTDNSLTALSTYYYKVRAINASSASSQIGPINSTTLASPAAPNPISSLTVTAQTATQTTISWVDNAANETGFEIQKSSSPVAGFTTIHVTSANVIQFTDNQLGGNSIVYYRIRALGEGGTASAFSSPVSCTTINTPPSIMAIEDRSVFSTSTYSINVVVSDIDNDAISFTFPNGLPGFASFQSDGFGRGVLTFTSAVIGVYTIRIQGSDGNATVSDEFVITVNSNHQPILSTIDNQTSEEGRITPLALSATDADTNPLTYSVVGLPPFASFNSVTRVISFNPSYGSAGIYENITVTVKDNQIPAGIDSKTFTLIVVPLDKSYSISVNFAYLSSNYEGSPWNNTTTVGADLTNLKDDQGNTVRLVTFNSATGWTNSNPRTGVLPIDPNSVYTKKVRESFYKRSTSSTTLVKFKNLNPALKYKATVYGAYPETAVTTRNTKYTITGASPSEVFEINTVNNTTTTRTSSYTFPNANGELVIGVSRGTGNPQFYYINSVILTAFFDEGVPPVAPSNLTIVSPAHNKVDLSWQDNSANETRFDILRSASASGPFTIVGSTGPNTINYSDNTTVGRSSYYYKISAVNTTGRSDSQPKLILTPNGLPNLAIVPVIIVKAGHVIQQNIAAIDPENDPIVLSTLNLPSFGNFVDNTNGTGSLQFTPQLGDVGSYDLTIKATDNFTAISEMRVTLVVLDSEYDEALWLNFKGNTTDAQNPWNNLQAFVSNPALMNSTGQPTSNFQLFVGSNWTGSSDNGGYNSASGQTVYPENVVKSFWSTNNSVDGATLTLSGLDNTKVYNLAFLGSLNEYWFANTTYTINGSSKVLSATKNSSNLARFTGIQPTGGSIVINVKKGTGLNVTPLTERDGLLNALTVERYTIGTNPRRPTNLITKGVSKNEIKLTWFDNSADESGFEIYRASNPSGPFTLLQTIGANNEQYIDSSLPSNNAYVYKVRAIKTSGNSLYSNDAAASTFAETVQININSSTHLQALPPWNNTSAQPISDLFFSNFKNDLGNTTTVGLQFSNWYTGAENNTGYVTGNNSGVYPDAVLENYYYFVAGDPTTEFSLTGLDQTKAYDLTFFGNEWSYTVGLGWSIGSDYSVGSKTGSLFNGKNTTQTVTIQDNRPETDGTLAFRIACGAGASAGVWNSLIVNSYTPLDIAFGGGGSSIARLKNSDPQEENIEISDRIEPEFEVYPNPVKDRLMIKLSSGIENDKPLNISIYNLQGQLITKQTSADYSDGIEVNTNEFVLGYYIILIEHSGRTSYRRFKKEY